MQDNKRDYIRLNVEHGLGKVKLDAWKGEKGAETLRLLRTNTETYLKSPAAREAISRSAQLLVNIRRARSSQPDLDHWERYCHGVEYACSVEECNDGGKRYRERRDLRRHLEEAHPLSCNPESIDSLLDRGKRFPLHGME